MFEGGFFFFSSHSSRYDLYTYRRKGFPRKDRYLTGRCCRSTVLVGGGSLLSRSEHGQAWDLFKHMDARTGPEVLTPEESWYQRV